MVNFRKMRMNSFDGYNCIISRYKFDFAISPLSAEHFAPPVEVSILSDAVSVICISPSVTQPPMSVVVSINVTLCTWWS